jgi:prepilin-type N-terminal cleavage/methylation domain-containing protein
MTAHNERGFSLIEVLVVIVIVGVLAGIGISQYASFKARGVDAKVASTVRQVAHGEEAYYTSFLGYTAEADALEGVAIDDVVVHVSAGNTGDLATSFRVVASHPAASRSYVWISDPAPGEPHLIEN